jgi:hypothetical protein
MSKWWVAFLACVPMALVGDSPAKADFLLNCRLMNPGDPLFSAHCKEPNALVRIRCRDQAECTVLKKQYYAKSYLSPIQSKPSLATGSIAQKPVGTLTTGTTQTLGGVVSTGQSTVSGVTSGASTAVSGTVSGATQAVGGVVGTGGSAVGGAVSTGGSVVGGAVGTAGGIVGGALNRL